MIGGKSESKNVRAEISRVLLFKIRDRYAQNIASGTDVDTQVGFVCETHCIVTVHQMMSSSTDDNVERTMDCVKSRDTAGRRSALEILLHCWVLRSWALHAYSPSGIAIQVHACLGPVCI